MKLYGINSKEGYRDFILKNYDEDIKYVEMLINDYSIKEEWPKIEIKINYKGKISDGPFFWSIMGALVISEKTKNELVEFWNDEKFELLPLYLENEVYYIVHVLELQDIEFGIKKDSEGNFSKIFNEKELLTKDIVDKGIFRIRLKNGKPYYPIFITEKFVELIENSTLKGFNFGEVWNSEVTGEV